MVFWVLNSGPRANIDLDSWSQVCVKLNFILLSFGACADNNGIKVVLLFSQRSFFNRSPGIAVSFSFAQNFEFRIRQPFEKSLSCGVNAQKNPFFSRSYARERKLCHFSKSGDRATSRFGQRLPKIPAKVDRITFPFLPLSIERFPSIFWFQFLPLTCSTSVLNRTFLTEKEKKSLVLLILPGKMQCTQKCSVFFCLCPFSFSS